MDNVIDLHRPQSGGGAATSAASGAVGSAAARAPVKQAAAHAVQFYEQEEFLFEQVAQFLTAGLQAGERVLVIATAVHREGILRRMHAPDTERARASGQLLLVDASETLARFMKGELPDGDLFQNTLVQLLAPMKARDERNNQVRAYGEMVDVLWREGNSRAAIRLEELWNEATSIHSFTLLCAYLMGNFYKQGDTAQFLEVCRNHDHVIPTESFTQLDDGKARLREISFLQQRARSLENEINHRKQLEDALRDALRERSRAEEELLVSVLREKEARERAEASDAFKEVFLAILGHDLRNPLSTILTTTRLIAMCGDVRGDSVKRLDRVLSSGMRMQRMIDQLLDMTRARLAGGISVTLRDQHDLAPLVTKIVEEVRVAHPQREIAFSHRGTCLAPVDSDRFEQVLSNLLSNAVAHGEPSKTITVTLSAGSDVISLKVHNYGAAIDASFLPLLFDPFKRGKRSEAASTGLGLGLYITERIVTAHGGAIEVESHPDQGTTFEVTLPSGT